MAEQTTEKQLIEKQQQLQEQLEELQKSDPSANQFRGVENSPEDDGDETEVGNRMSATRRIIREQLRRVTNALHKLRHGSYSVCDRCGKPISKERLEAVPEATYCIECERELENK